MSTAIGLIIIIVFADLWLGGKNCTATAEQIRQSIKDLKAIK